MTPLLCACAVVITLETQKCRKGAPRSVEVNFFINCDRHKRFSQNERRKADLQNAASDFLIFAQGLSYDLSKLGDDFTPFFRLWKTITKCLDQQLNNLRQRFVAMNMMNKCAKFHKDSPSGKKVKFNLARAIELSETFGRFGVQLCIETLCKRTTSVAHLTNFSFEFVYEIFNFQRRCLSISSIPWCKKVKNDQKLKSRGGGSCLKVPTNDSTGHLLTI